MIRINLEPEIEKRLTQQAEERGQTFTAYVEELLATYASNAAKAGATSEQNAVQALRDLRRGKMLSGLNVTSLVHGGHRY